MKTLRILCFWVIALMPGGLKAEDIFDQIDDVLNFNAFQGNVRARLSGLLDLELYQFELPPPGLIDANDHFLFNPRLSLFLDAEIGPQVYFFVQSRVDRGFDPSDEGVEVRLDEYAIRFRPWRSGYFELKAGKFATVTGNFVPRHLSWENPFVNAPLPYEQLIPISDRDAPLRLFYFLTPRELTPDEYTPIIWGPNYATGASVAGKIGIFSYAVEVKNAALASRPESWDATRNGFDYPTFGGRLGLQPNEAWNFGLSASEGPYFRSEATPTLPAGHDIGDYHQIVIGQDISYAIHHLQFWAEFYEARFQVPRVGNADTFAYYLEAKYKLTPQLFCAVRWNQQFFGTVANGRMGEVKWGDDLWRIDSSIGYRFTAHIQLKLQYSLQTEVFDSSNLGHMIAAQLTLRF